MWGGKKAKRRAELLLPQVMVYENIKDEQEFARSKKDGWSRQKR